jgi:inosine/xanthosine triphosphate pyrophosphatase family protein
MNTFIFDDLFLFLVQEASFAAIANSRQSTELACHNRANAFNKFLPALSKAVTSHNSNQIATVARIGA